MLRQFLRTDYRSLVTLVAEWQKLRRALRLRKVPQYSILAYAACRLLPEAEKGGSSTTLKVVIIGRGRAAGLIDASPMAAVDATGLETRYVSEHFGKRCGEGKGSGHRQRAWPKLTAVLHTHSHLIVGAVTGIGPSQDSPDFMPVIRQAASIMAFGAVLADAGYDAEHTDTS